MKKSFIFSAILLALFFIPLAPANGQGINEKEFCKSLSAESRSGGLVPCGRSCDDPTTSGRPGDANDETRACALCDGFSMFRRIVNMLLFQIVPILAALMIGIGGLMYVISYAGGFMGGAGGPELVNKANTLFKSVAIGILIMYGAWIIVNTFLAVFGVTIWNGFGNWWTFQCESNTLPSPQIIQPTNQGVNIKW